VPSRQPAYKAAIARGAVEILMPALPQPIALEIERVRVHYRQAMDGIAPEGRKAANLMLMERSEVRLFLEQMRTEFQIIDGWMPWT
jgi:hypothetical protein